MLLHSQLVIRRVGFIVRRRFVTKNTNAIVVDMWLRKGPTFLGKIRSEKSMRKKRGNTSRFYLGENAMDRLRVLNTVAAVLAPEFRLGGSIHRRKRLRGMLKDYDRVAACIPSLLIEQRRS